MDALLAKLTEALLSHGILGVIIVGLGLWLWKLQDRYDAVQEKRVQDAKTIAEAAHTFAAALDRNTETLRSLAED